MSENYCHYSDLYLKEMNQSNKETLRDNADKVSNPIDEKQLKPSSVLPSPDAYRNIEVRPTDENALLDEQKIDRIIEMAWEDRTPFDAIFNQFGLREDEVKQLMKRELTLKSYQRWRERVENCKTKHLKTRSTEINRFKCDRQRTISNNKISKR
jgi:uncharacterized protein (TIGR03643 family)